MRKTILIPESGKRLDRCLAELLPDYSRSYLQKLLSEGRACWNGKVLKASWKTKTGLLITLDIPEPEPTDIKPEAIELDIVYEDSWIIVINKPQGMVVHPAAGHRQGTLVHALLHHCSGQLSDINGVIRPGIVHRIDKDTSGLLIAVKDNQIHRKISEQIRRHEVNRIYQAIVHDRVTVEKGLIDAPIGRDPRNRKRMAVVPGGKPAISRFKTLQSSDRASWLEVELETGRTHQIRVHMQYIGHPIVGDPLYAGHRPDYGLKGQALHAGRIVFEHPMTGQTLDLRVDPPDSFLKGVALVQ